MDAVQFRDHSRAQFRSCKRHACSVLLAAAAVFQAEASLADGSSAYVGPVVVTGARVPQRLSDALQSVTTISAEDVERAGQQTLVELLQALGGVEISSTGGAGQPTSVFLRGANSAQTLVLLDGMRVASATTGTTALENIPLDQIDHIEIVAGPLSSLYGSDAVGGVIQIFTKRGTAGSSGSIYAGAGTYDTQRLNGSLSATHGDTDVFLSAGYTNSKSFDATTEAIPFDQHNPDRDAYRNANFLGKLTQRFGPDNELGVDALYSDGNTHFDASPTSDDVNHQTISAYSLRSRNRINDVWESLLRIGTTEDDIRTRGAFPSSFRTNQDQAVWQNTFSVTGGSIIAGGEFLRQRVASDTAFSVSRRNVGSVFAGYQAQWGAHGLQLNVREDDNSQFGSHTTGSVGYGYRVADGLRVRVSAGNAFHAPTFNDLYFPIFGNPYLKAERSVSAEAGVDYEVHAQRFGVTYFENRISDLIVFDTATFLPANLARARIRGVEFSYQGRVWDTDIRAKTTLQNPVDTTTDTLLPRRAREFGSISATRAWDRWQFGTEVIASGPRYEAAAQAPGSRMGGYALLNVFATLRVGTDWSLEMRWNNVTDKHYELAQFFNTPGSNVFVSVRWTSAR